MRTSESCIVTSGTPRDAL